MAETEPLSFFMKLDGPSGPMCPPFQLYFSSISLEIQMPIAHAPIRISHFPCLDRYPFLLAYILPVFRDLPTAVALQLQVPPESRRWKGKLELTEVPSQEIKTSAIFYHSYESN